MNLWHGIDANDAEARLRGLNRRLAELDEAMKDGQRMLASYPDSFSASLAVDSLSQLQQRLQDERVKLVQHRKRECVSISLNGSPYNDHTANLGQLGFFLVRMQALYHSIGQAITSGPRLRGPISHEVLRSTDLRFAGVFPSSFGMEIYVASAFDDVGDSTSVSALQTLFNLLSATRRDEEITRLSAELGQRALNHLRHVLGDLSKVGAGFSMKWIDSAGTDFSWSADRDDVNRLRANVSRFSELYVGERIMEGYLIGASLLRNRFEFMDINRQIYEGRITKAVKPKLREFFGKLCQVKLDQMDILEHEEPHRSFYTMIDIEARQRIEN